MSYLPIGDCLERSRGSIYKFTTMVARRAQEIAEGSKPLVESLKDERPINIAIREIQEGYLRIEPDKKSKK